MSRRARFTRNLGREVPAPKPRRDLLRYVRFEHATERVQGVAFGPFSYVADARELLRGDDLAELNGVMTWFCDHLEEPGRMVPFRDVGEKRARRRKHESLALCWFREDATEHIAKARLLVEVLARADIPFVERWSDRLPGKLCAEDHVQVAVVPFHDSAREEEG